MEMDELGYDIEWQNFNSKYYVPQNRERIYTVGHLRSRGSAKILPIMPPDGEDRVCDIDIIGHRENYRRNTQIFGGDGITEALDTGPGGGQRSPYSDPDNAKKNEIIPINCSLGNGIMGEVEQSVTLRARDYKGISKRQANTAVAYMFSELTKTETDNQGGGDDN